MLYVFVAAAARLAAHLALIAAASCSRRSGGRFTVSLSRCCSKLLFQLGELLCTFLVASFEPPDLFLETFKLIHMDEEMFRRPLMRMTDWIST